MKKKTVLLLAFLLVLCLFSCEKKCEHKNTVEEITVQPTCTKNGQKAVTCVDCGYAHFDAIPALGHTEEVLPGKAPTATEPGLTEGKKCPVCGEILEEQKEIPAQSSSETKGGSYETPRIPI